MLALVRDGELGGDDLVEVDSLSFNDGEPLRLREGDMASRVEEGFQYVFGVLCEFSELTESLGELRRESRFDDEIFDHPGEESFINPSTLGSPATLWRPRSSPVSVMRRDSPGTVSSSVIGRTRAGTASASAIRRRRAGTASTPIRTVAGSASSASAIRRRRAGTRSASVASSCVTSPALGSGGDISLDLVQDLEVCMDGLLA